MATRNYRGGKLRSKALHGQNDMPVNDAPVEQHEVTRIAPQSALPLLEKYRKTAEQGTNRKALQRHRERTQVWQMWCSGRTPGYIATTTGLYLDTVNKHIAYFRENIEEGLRAVPMLAGAELVLHYQNIYHESIDAWHRSKLPRTRNTRTQRTTTGEDIETQDTTADMTEHRDGDPRFLERAQVALDRIALIQGQVRPGGMNPIQQTQAATEAQVQNRARAIIYLPSNGRDESDGEVLDAIPEEPVDGGRVQAQEPPAGAVPQ